MNGLMKLPNNSKAQTKSVLLLMQSNSQSYNTKLIKVEVYNFW